MRLQFTALLLGLVGPAVLSAQDRPAEIVAGGGGRYPEVLKAAGIGGVVHLRVVVLPGDTLAPGGITVLSAAHPGFNAAAREMVAHWTYRSAVIGGAPAVDTLDVAIEYRLVDQGSVLFDTTAIEGPAREGPRSWSAALVPLALRRASRPIPASTKDSVAIAVARYVVRFIDRSSGGGAPIVCVSLRTDAGSDPLTPTEWLAVQLPGIAMVHPRRCPPSFGSMAYIKGRVLPPGPGPTELSIDSVEGWDAGWVVAHLHLGRGLYDCAVREESPGAVVKCRLIGSEVY